MILPKGWKAEIYCEVFGEKRLGEKWLLECFKLVEIENTRIPIPRLGDYIRFGEIDVKVTKVKFDYPKCTVCLWVTADLLGRFTARKLKGFIQNLQFFATKMKEVL